MGFPRLRKNGKIKVGNLEVEIETEYGQCFLLASFLWVAQLTFFIAQDHLPRNGSGHSGLRTYAN